MMTIEYTEGSLKVFYQIWSIMSSCLYSSDNQFVGWSNSEIMFEGAKIWIPFRT